VTDKSYQLVVRKGPQPGKVFPLSSQNMSIGRDPMSDITVIDPEVSRYHAQLLQTEEGFQIQDMGSTNGTFIDGEHLGGQPAILTPGQTVQLGSSVVLVFEAVPEEEDVLATVADSSPDLRPIEPLEEPAPADLFEADDQSDFPAFEPEPPLPAFKPPPRIEPSTGPLVTPSEGSGDSKRRRRTIIIVILILLLCCCCAFLITGYFYWGDPLLNFLVDLGLMNWLRDLGFSI